MIDKEQVLAWAREEGLHVADTAGDMVLFHAWSGQLQAFAKLAYSAGAEGSASRLCLVCGEKSEPCMTEADLKPGDPGVPCTFDPTPQELYADNTRLRKEVDMLREQIRLANIDVANSEAESAGAKHGTDKIMALADACVIAAFANRGLAVVAARAALLAALEGK